MVASRAVGYALLGLLVGAVLLSLVILGVQWVRSSDTSAKSAVPKASSVLYYEAPLVAQVVYPSLSEVRFEV
jgi:cytochrome c biogenesis protein ResB